MKIKGIISLALSALASTFIPVAAQSPNIDVPSADPEKYIPIDKRGKEVPNRPQMPSRQHIECLYAGGSLSFFFAVPEGECVLTVTDSASGISMQYYFDSADSAEIYVGEIETGSIEISTAKGNEYVGFID